MNSAPVGFKAVHRHLLDDAVSGGTHLRREGSMAGPPLTLIYSEARPRAALATWLTAVKTTESGALPLVLTHGWPGSVVEYLDLICPLTDPRGHGTDPANPRRHPRLLRPPVLKGPNHPLPGAYHIVHPAAALPGHDARTRRRHLRARRRDPHLGHRRRHRATFTTRRRTRRATPAGSRCDGRTAAWLRLRPALPRQETDDPAATLPRYLGRNPNWPHRAA